MSAIFSGSRDASKHLPRFFEIIMPFLPAGVSSSDFDDRLADHLTLVEIAHGSGRSAHRDDANDNRDQPAFGDKPQHLHVAHALPAVGAEDGLLAVPDVEYVGIWIVTGGGAAGQCVPTPTDG